MKNLHGKKIIVNVSIFVLIGFLFIFVNKKIDNNRIAHFSPLAENYDGNYAYQIEKVELNDDEIVIEGWFFELKKSKNISRNVEEGKKTALLLYDISEKEENELVESNIDCKGIPLNMEYLIREDVDEYFKCEYDYSHCGFIARIDKSKVDLTNKEYQIVFKPDEEAGIGLKSNAYLIDGKYSNVSREDSFKLDVSGTDLEQIVNQGVCVAACPEYHVSVYQYGWELYWIADENYNFESDGLTYIQFQMNTTQFEKLPQDRIDNGWYWSNIGGNFEDYEITKEINCEKYRVCKRAIPVDYSVVYISTGYYIDDKYDWNRHIRPVYMFES